MKELEANALTWETLDAGFRLSSRVLEELLEGGQTFQWERDRAMEATLDPEGKCTAIWIGILDGVLVRLRLASDGCLQFSSLRHDKGQKVRDALGVFFLLNEPHELYLEGLPLEQDSYLLRCVESFPGLRILRQPVEKVILTFLCSSNKQIPQIRQMLHNLSRELGEEVEPGWWEYPSWEVLAQADLEVLRRCRTGYRCNYIQASARYIAADPDFFRRLKSLPFAEARAELMCLPGVGEKVADCILLYGGGRYESFPLDTWILKAMEHRYGLSGLKRNEVLKWAQQHFGEYAGIAQQFIFAYEREVRELTKRRKS